MATQFGDCPSRAAWAKFSSATAGRQLARMTSTSQFRKMEKNTQKARSEGMQHPQTLQVCPMFSINSENTCICIWKWSLFNKASILKSLVPSWLVSDHCCYPHVFNFASRLHWCDCIPTWENQETLISERNSPWRWIDFINGLYCAQLPIQQGMFSSTIQTSQSHFFRYSELLTLTMLHPTQKSLKNGLSFKDGLVDPTCRPQFSQGLLPKTTNSKGFEGSWSLISRPHSWEPPGLNQVYIQSTIPTATSAFWLLKPWSVECLFISKCDAEAYPLRIFTMGRFASTWNQQPSTNRWLRPLCELLILNSLEDPLDWIGLQKKTQDLTLESLCEVSKAHFLGN